ncbi:MAG: hypothetical protein ACI89X_003025 [Planctomycetota bacterium]|jgi:hypothetical protein
MLSRIQELLVMCLRESDPRAFLQATVPSDSDLTDEERGWLLAVDEDGLRLTRMLIRKLRLQRIVRGDAEASAYMARDPAGFAACFARYDQEVAWTCVFPREEAQAFRRYW